MNKTHYQSETTLTKESVVLLSWKRFLAFSAGLVSITTLVYKKSLSYPFQFDDLANITKKFDIRFLNFSEHFCRHSRWVGEFLNRVNYQVGEWFRYGGGGFDPYFYRLFNLAIHIITGIMIFNLIYQLCKRSKHFSFALTWATEIGLTTSALFLLHPVQTQTISYIIQARLEGLATLFIVMALSSFLKAVDAKSNSGKITWYGLTILIGFFSCGTKEIVIALPFLLFLVDWFFLKDEDYDSFLQRLWFHGFFFATVLGTLIYYLKPQFLVDILFGRLQIQNNRGNIVTKSPLQSITAGNFLPSQFKVILHYVSIFFFPFNLSVEYDWKLAASFFAIDSLLPFLILFIATSYSLLLFTKKKYSLEVFSWWWFLISIAPRATIIPSPELICDYKTYLSSIGILFFIGLKLVQLYSSIRAYIEQHYQSLLSTPFARYGVQASTLTLCGHGCFILFASGVGAGSYARNIVWRSPVDFWKNIVERAPLKARGQNNLGTALSEEGRFQEAIPYFKQAINLDIHYPDPWSNLAVAYSAQGNHDEAIQVLREAIKRSPYYPEAHNNLGSLLLEKNKFEEAEIALKNALAMRPHYGKAWLNLGRLYLTQNKNDEAWNCFTRATETDLDVPAAFYIRGRVGFQLGKYAAAIDSFKEAQRRLISTEVLPAQMAQIDFELANAYFLNGSIDEAESLYEKLAKNYPQELKFSYNLAECYFNKRHYLKAEELYKNIAHFGAPPQCHQRILQCLEQREEFDGAVLYAKEQLARTTIPDDMKSFFEGEVTRLSLSQHLKKTGGILTAADMERFFKGSVKISPSLEEESEALAQAEAIVESEENYKA